MRNEADKKRMDTLSEEMLLIAQQVRHTSKPTLFEGLINNKLCEWHKIAQRYRAQMKKDYYSLLKRKGYTGISIRSFDSGNILVEAHKPKFCKFIDFQAERRSSSYPDEITMMDENEYNITSTRAIPNDQL